MRAGKAGGGKGALVGEGLSHTLATGNDQVCFDLRRGVGSEANAVAPTLVATDRKGGKAISFFAQFLGKGTAPTEECCGTLVNAGAPGHSNAIILFDQHNGERFSPCDETANSVLAHYGTGGNNTPIVLEEPFGFQKVDAGGVPIPQHTGIAPTLRSQARTSVAVAERGSAPDAAEDAASPHNVVRRLLPVECERLQGMPDNYTRIAWKGKPEAECPDAPCYKAIGNSMAVNVMRWIGERIQCVEERNND